MQFKPLKTLLFAALTILAMPEGSASAKEDEVVVPGAPRLLPEDTFAYIRFDDVDELREEFKDTSVSKMLADPAMRPLAGDVYRTVSELFEVVGSQMGVTLEELLAIPSGQVSAALVPGNLSREQIEMIEQDSKDESPEGIRRRLARKRRNQNSLAGWFMVDAGDNIDRLSQLVGVLESKLFESGYVQRKTKVSGTTLVRLLPPRPGRPEIEYFQRDNTIILGIGHATASKSLEQWDEKGEENTLAENADFAAVMSHCIGAEKTRPQVTFFVDPYHIIERLVKRGGAAGFVWPIIEELGLGKIRGIGGSSFQGGDVFESIAHLHVLVDPPRDGFFGVLRPESGESMPPSWVPEGVSSYTSIHWDFEQTYENLGKVIEKFRGPEPLKSMVEDPVASALKISVRDELANTLSNRYVSCAWIQPPIKLNSQVQLHAFEVLDTDRAKEIFAKIRERFSKRMTVDSYGGKVIYGVESGRQRNLPKGFRVPEPGFVVLDDWVVFSDSRQFLERIIQASADNLPRLTNDLQFELILSELGGKLDGETPFLVSFMRGSEYMRQMYGLATSPDTKQFLKSVAERNPAAQMFSELLDRNELPDFEQFKKYFAPSGSFAYDEAGGMHVGSFTLRAEPE